MRTQEVIIPLVLYEKLVCVVQQVPYVYVLWELLKRLHAVCKITLEQLLSQVLYHGDTKVVKVVEALRVGEQRVPDADNL